MSAPDREALRTHLADARIAGDVATTREDNLMKFGLLAAGVPKSWFGIEPEGRWHLDDILALMAEKVGVSPDPWYLRGPDRIDADRTLDALDRMAKHLATAARDRSRVLLATGHPAGLLVVHQDLARSLGAAGATVIMGGDGFAWQSTTRWGKVDRHVRYVGGVAVASDMGSLNHTHSAQPMRGVLAALAEAGEPPPDLVVADHGWAGAAGQAGITTVGFADSNDPALFVGEAEGKIAVAVPLDDNVPPHLYAPLTAYLLHAAGLRGG